MVAFRLCFAVLEKASIVLTLEKAVGAGSLHRLRFHQLGLEAAFVGHSAATAAVCTVAGFVVGCTLVQGVVAAFPTHLQRKQ